MRNIIPIIFVAATLLAGCCSPAPANKTTTAGTNAAVNTNTVASSSAVAATPVGPNTPAETLSENVRLGNLGATFIVILTIMAVRRP
jgi:hypothetical protein